MEYIVKKEDWDSFVKEFNRKYKYADGKELDYNNPFIALDETVLKFRSYGIASYNKLVCYELRGDSRAYKVYQPRHKPASQFTQVTTPRFCDNCGFYINDDSLYCWMCGTKVEENWYDKH